jgi:hypothetical protein
VKSVGWGVELVLFGSEGGERRCYTDNYWISFFRDYRGWNGSGARAGRVQWYAYSYKSWIRLHVVARMVTSPGLGI